MSPRRESRRYPRVQISWPVVVEAGSRLFHLRTTNVSLLGAKLCFDERLEEGTRAKLVFQPPDGQAVGVEAIVWRVDEDGLAFFFLEPAPVELLRSVNPSPPPAP